jgi:RNA polymerase sigma factor (sigma-70 family)
MEGTIVRAAQCGDTDALATIVDEFMPTVLAAAYGWCGDWDLAGDIAQEVFATLLARLGDLRDPAALPGWLLAVVRSSARRERRAPHSVPFEAAPPGPEELVIARDEAQRVRLALEALPPELRVPMALHYFAALPLAEIAALCELPLSTVKQRMRVARARLREGLDEMADEMTLALRPDPQSDPTDVIRMYTAMRSGDVERVAAILDARPDLVDVREDWTRAESFAHRLPWTRGGGTPLLRAVERGDVAMVRLLLARGADPSGACTCAGGESALWVAVVQREAEIVDLLLTAGANPDPVAFAGASALDIASARGYDDIAERLRTAGSEQRRPGYRGEHRATHRAGAMLSHARAYPHGGVAADATGIKAIDLWCPLPVRGLVHLTPGFGLGAVVLVGELSLRAVRNGRAVTWTGFVQAPTDLGDIHHALAEGGLSDGVRVSLAPPTAPLREQVAAFERGVRGAEDRDLVVVFAETGRLHAVDERLGDLARRDGVTLVVAPLDGTVSAPRRDGSPYLASIVFDAERAKRQRWPAIGSDSWSKAGDAETQTLAARARAEMSEELDEYLCQPFFVAEHVTGQMGESVSVEELRAHVAALLD